MKPAHLSKLPRLAALAMAGFSLIHPGSLAGGDGRWNGDDVELHLYLEDRADPSDVLGTGSGTWESYLRTAAQHYYDSHEGRSRITKVYVYNGLPDGKNRADIWVGGTSGPQAVPSGFRQPGRFLMLPAAMREMAARSDHYAKSLAHEVGHYFYGLRDVYGGQIMLSGTNYQNGVTLPVEFVTEAARPLGNPSPDSLNYRTYMWSDEWLRRRRVPLLQSLLGGPNERAFFNLSGRRGTGGQFTQDSLMGGNFNLPAGVPTRDAEFATPASHVGPRQFTFKMPAFTYKVSETTSATWPADAAPRTYTLVNNQQWAHGASDWTVIAAYHNSRSGRATNWTVPAELSKQTLDGTAARPFPQVILVGDSAIVICLDRSGSMTSENRMTLAKAGAQSAINLMRVRGGETPTGQFAGLSSFASSATLDRSIEEISSPAVKTAMSAAVQSLAASGATSIGSGLRVSMDALMQHPEKSKAIILLSDGYQNSGEAPGAVLPALVSNKISVYTIALGDSADRALLASIAQQTGGKSRVTNNAADLIQFFHDLFATLNGSSSGSTKDVTIPAGGQLLETVKVERDCRRATFSAQLDQPWMKVRLRRPNGTFLEPGRITDATVAYQFANNQAVFDVQNPLPGDWSIVVDNRVASISGGPFAKKETPVLRVPDLGTVTSPLEVRADGVCNQLKVNVDIRHTYIGDLRVRLISPSGRSVILHNRSGSSTDNIVGTYGQRLVPAQPLTAFDGDAMRGTWQLEVMDSGSGDTGELRSWSLTYGGSSQQGAASVAHSLNNPRIIVTDAAQAATVAYPAPLPIRASVVAFGAPIAGARAAATVSGPDGSSQQIALFDNGAAEHGDERANDGIYSNLFTGYTASGVYDIAVEVVNEKGWQVRHADATPSLSTTRAAKVPPFERMLGVQVNVTGVPVNTARWFQLDALQLVSNTTRRDADSLNMKGLVNVPQTPGFDASQQGFAFQVGNVRGSTLNGPTVWKRVGRSNRWTYKVGTYSIVTDYFIGGSSRSTWAVDATRQNLGTPWSNPASVPVSLTLGSMTDSLSVKMDGTGTTWRMGTRPATPEFYASTLAYSLNTTLRGRDGLIFTGKVSGPFSFNPAVNSLRLAMDSFTLSIPAGGWTTTTGGRLVFRQRPTTGPMMELTYDTDKGTLSLRVDRADFTARRGNPMVRLSLTLGGISSATWTYQLGLTGNTAMTSYRY